jgi:hypothetical protein
MQEPGSRADRAIAVKNVRQLGRDFQLDVPQWQETLKGAVMVPTLPSRD